MTGVAVAVIALGIVVFGIHRVAVAAEARGWIYYRNRPKGPVDLGLLAVIYAPEIEHVIEERSSEAIRRIDEESGDRPWERLEP